MTHFLTSGWNWAVIGLVVANILGCLALLIWTSRGPAKGSGGSDDTGHVWDGDLREYNNPLPRWWLNLFVITIVFAVAYLALYPGLGNVRGKLGWTSASQHDANAADLAARRAAVTAPFEGRSIGELRHDPRALALGSKLFQNNCAGCHGVDAQGAKHFPNLADNDWLYGNGEEQVFTTITQGRNGQMPAFYSMLDAAEAQSLIAYVRDWKQGHQGAEYEAGAKKFAGTCAACHGADGAGNTVLGAPRLNDATWLHGGSSEDIRETILFGRKSQMPAFETLLSDTERRVVAGYVLSLSDVQP